MTEQRKTDLSQDEKQISPLVTLADLAVDVMAYHLDVKSLARLQLTCRSLFVKCHNSQRLQTVHLSKIFCQDRGWAEPSLFIGSRREDECQLTDTQFECTRFHFNADTLVFMAECNNVVIRKILTCLSGRGTVKKLDLASYSITDEVDPNLFNRMLQELRITELEVKGLSPTFWQLPAVKQLTSIRPRNFPMPLGYLAETAFERLSIGVGNRRSNFMDLNTILKKWANGEKEIKRWYICIPHVDEEQLFEGFYRASNDPEENRNCPLVTYSLDYYQFTDGWLKRADGKKLFIKYEYYDNALIMQDTPFYKDTPFCAD